MTRFVSVATILGVMFLVTAGPAAALPGVTLTQLPVIENPDGTHGSSASSSNIGWAINGSGQVAGYGQVFPSVAFVQLHPGPYPGLTHPFVYGGGTMTDLTVNGLNGNLYTPTPPDGNVYGSGDAFGINNSGTVVGVALNTAINSNRAFVTSGGSMMSMDAYDSTISQSRAYGVSSSGTVVGNADYATGWNAVTYSYSGTYSAATGVYSGGSWSYTDINSLLGAATGAGSGGGSKALAINSANTVTGFATATAGDGIAWNSRPQAFVLNSAGAVTILPAPAGMDSTQGNAINTKGDVAGTTWSSSNSGSYSPMLAVNSGGGYTVTNLGVPAGNYGNCYGYGLNDYDMVTGVAWNNTTGAYEGYLWTTGVVPFYGLSVGANDLNTLAAGALPSGWSITSVRGVNDAGQIVGSAEDASTQYHSIMLSLPQAVPGDANLDGKVDINDLTIVLAHYNDSLSMNWGTGDFTGSGKVDINDLTIVLAHYNQTAGTAASFSAVPEPGSLLLLVLAASGWVACAWRRRR